MFLLIPIGFYLLNFETHSELRTCCRSAEMELN